MLGGNPRLARCFTSVTQAAQWDGGGVGSAMGIAGYSAYGSHIALAATATIGEDQRPKVHRLVAAVDCGRFVNSGLVTQQIAGGLIWALAQATMPQPEWVLGMRFSHRLGESIEQLLFEQLLICEVKLFGRVLERDLGHRQYDRQFRPG